MSTTTKGWRRACALCAVAASVGIWGALSFGGANSNDNYMGTTICQDNVFMAELSWAIQGKDCSFTYVRALMSP